MSDENKDYGEWVGALLFCYSIYILIFSKHDEGFFDAFFSLLNFYVFCIYVLIGLAFAFIVKYFFLGIKALLGVIFLAFVLIAAAIALIPYLLYVWFVVVPVSIIRKLGGSYENQEKLSWKLVAMVYSGVSIFTVALYYLALHYGDAFIPIIKGVRLH